MKLYRINLYNTDSGWPILTHFRTSLHIAKGKAKEVINDTAQSGLVTIQQVEVNTSLKVEDWIKLLEADAPGLQDQELTPIDLITSAKEVWRKEFES